MCVPVPATSMPQICALSYQDYPMPRGLGWTGHSPSPSSASSSLHRVRLRVSKSSFAVRLWVYYCLLIVQKSTPCRSDIPPELHPPWGISHRVAQKWSRGRIPRASTGVGGGDVRYTPQRDNAAPTPTDNTAGSAGSQCVPQCGGFLFNRRWATGSQGTRSNCHSDVYYYSTNLGHVYLTTTAVASRG